MALSQQVKTAVDGMSRVDQALLVLYVLGIDGDTAATKVGRRVARRVAAHIASPTNEELGLALLLDLRNHLATTFVQGEVAAATTTAQAAAVAAIEAARAAAQAEVQMRDIGSLPAPVGGGG